MDGEADGVVVVAAVAVKGNVRVVLATVSVAS